MLIRGVPGLTPLPLDHTGPGIYFLCRGETVTYIGQAVNTIARISDHLRERGAAREWDGVFYVPCPLADLCAAETYFIALYRPEGNRKHARRRFADIEAECGIPAWITRDADAEAASEAAIIERPARCAPITVRCGEYRVTLKRDARDGRFHGTANVDGWLVPINAANSETAEMSLRRAVARKAKNALKSTP